MRKVIVMLIAIFIAATASSQTDMSKGKVYYETIRKIEIKIQGDAERFQDMLPKERKSMRELIFNSDASLYTSPNAGQNDDEVEHESIGGANITLKMVEPNEIIYCDLKSKINLEQREFMTRTFLIETKADTAQWKLTGNQKSILDYNCMEAELVGAKRKTIAWFTPVIPVSTGPDGYVGLPGLILAMDIDNGKIVYNAVKVDMIDIDPSLLVKPKDGKKLTKKEFNKIVDEKRKEMGAEGGSGATMIIRTR